VTESNVTAGEVLSPGDMVLVTGGAGYVGSHLVRMLLAKGYRVRVLDCFLYGDMGLKDCYSNPRLEVLRGDICNIRDLIRCMRGVRAVIALAALVGDGACELDHEETLAINVESTKLLSQVVRLAPEVKRVVFASSCSVYGANEGLVLNEGSVLNPVSFYARSRIVSEGILNSELEDCSVVTLRLGTVFGTSPRMRLDLMVNTMTARALSGGKVTVMGGEAWRPHVHVQDVARAFLAAAEAPSEEVSGEIFNVGGNSQNHTIGETADIVAAALPDLGIAVEHVAAVDDLRSYKVSFDKIEYVLKFKPKYSVQRGVEQLRGLLSGGALEVDDPVYSNLIYLRQYGFGGKRVDLEGEGEGSKEIAESA